MRSAPAAEAWERPGPDLLADYDVFVGQLRCGSQGKYVRRMAARRFLARWPDPTAWMARSTSARLADIGRTGAWPFLTWAFVSGALKADLDLLGARANGGHLSAWASCHPDDTAQALAVATELGWGRAWAHQVCVNALALVCMTTQRTLDGLDAGVLDNFAGELTTAPSITANHRRVLVGRLGGLRQVCFQLGLVQEPPPHPNCRPRSWAEHVSAIPQPEIRRVAQRYLEVIATTLRPATVEDRGDNLESFALWLGEHHPDIGRLSQLDRPVIEEFLIWNRTRPSRGRRGRGRPVSTVRVHQGVATLKTFFEDLALWCWAERPPRLIVHRSDLPRLPEAVPRALPPDVDRELMNAVDRLDDVAGRCAIRILRGTGMRVGELLELELDCLLDFAGRGSWVRVPLGKLASERTVPVDDETLVAFDEWAACRGRQRALPHPRTGRPADFLFVIGGRRMGPSRVRRGLDTAARLAGLVDAAGHPRHVTPHQLRHTYGTTLVNGGMSLQALMALLGHVTPEMTMRYANLASDTVRDAYDAAMARTRTKKHLLVAGVGGAFVPERVEWLHAEMLKTRVAHGYCSRHPAAGACPYANICEQCDNFATGPEFSTALEDQLADVRALQQDAAARGWEAEAARHDRVIISIESHTRRLRAAAAARELS
jgi:integrase